LTGALWYAIASIRSGEFLGGDSVVGLVCGIAAALIIIFEMLLWPRKALRRLRLAPAKHWMAAHIWFGLACLPLAMLHAGCQVPNSMLAITLMIALLLAVISGVYGLVLQNILPSWMLRHLPAETIYSQINYVSQQAVEDAHRLLLAVCGPDPARSPEEMGQHRASAADASLAEPGVPQAVVVGAVRTTGNVRGRVLRTTAVLASKEDASILWDAFRALRPFLLRGASAGGPVADTRNADRWFDLLRRSCTPAGHEILNALQQLCDQRRQFDVQRRVHYWLHGWIPLHVGLSVAVVILLAAHIITALKYL
jgi:hypothetical protein